jgi:iron-sulfur cluster assembly protein
MTSVEAKPILTLTDTAMARARDLLEKRKAAGLRIAIKTRGCSGLAYDVDYAQAPSLGDEVVTQEGVTVFIDPQAILYILGSEMDYAEDKFFSGFLFRNPNEKGRCGCGESFHI